MSSASTNTTDHVEMLESTLNLLDEGVAILDDRSNVVFWNLAAATLTGYSAQDVTSRPCPRELYRVDAEHRERSHANMTRFQSNSHSSGFLEEIPEAESGDRLPCPTLVTLVHRLGHAVPSMLSKTALRTASGEHRGTALLFYPIEDLDVLPHGEFSDGIDIERSQAEMEDRLDAAQHKWITAGQPFGLLWIKVDQAQTLRRTHGREATEAMLRTVEHTLQRQLKPAEVVGRWGNNEFLVLAHERTSDLLLELGRRLVGVARTSDFRWWGDRVCLTVSIGASQANRGDTLQTLLGCACQAMQTSAYAGGNLVTEARKK
jgi:diguanylate cyclase (GGDEF)-like protein/PAS domain S-box-containing protein